MPNILLPITNGSLPEGFCPATEQERLNGFTAATNVVFPFNFALLNTGSTAPTADNRIYPWYRSNPDGTPDKLYSFINGFWIAPNPVPASSPIRFFYRGSEASLINYDGGESGSVTTIAGPMWEIDTDMSGKLPLGVSDDFAYNSTGGNMNIQLSIPQLPTFTINIPAGSDLDEGVLRTEAATADAEGGTHGTISSNSVGDGADINIMNPYLAGFWIRRTNRVFYRL